VNQESVDIRICARLGKYIRSVLLKPGDFCNGQIDRESFPGQTVELLLPQRLLQGWQEFARPFIHPQDAIDQGAVVLIERDKGFALVRNAESLQPFPIHPTHSLSNGVNQGYPPGFSRLLMPGRLGSQQRDRTVATGNRSATTIPDKRLTGGCAAIETDNQGGKIFHHLSCHFLRQELQTCLLFRPSLDTAINR
jgi:hypothetical protein